MLLCPSLHKAPAPYSFPMNEKADTLSFADSADYIHPKENGLLQEFTRRRNDNGCNYATESSFTTDTRVTRNLSLQKTTWKMEITKNDKDQADSNCCVLPRLSTATHFVNLQFLLCFLIHLTFMFMTLIHIITHFPDHPVHSFFTIHLSKTHHSVQPITMQFVYAISYLMPLQSLE